MEHDVRPEQTTCNVNVFRVQSVLSSASVHLSGGMASALFFEGLFFSNFAHLCSFPFTNTSLIGSFKTIFVKGLQNNDERLK